MHPCLVSVSLVCLVLQAVCLEFALDVGTALSLSAWVGCRGEAGQPGGKGSLMQACPHVNSGESYF